MRSMQFFVVVALTTAFAISATAHEGHHGPESFEAAPAASAHAVETASRPAVDELTALRMHLAQPEYWHVLIHPFPVLGMALAAPLLLFALAVRSRGAKEAGLVLIMLAALGAFTTVKIGQRAYDRVDKGLERESQQWLDVHMERAEDAQWAFYLTGLLAALALTASRRKPAWEGRATLGALSGALLCSALGGWIAHAGGQVRHAEFRLGPPTTPVRAEGMRHER